MENEEGYLRGIIKKTGVKKLLIIGLCGIAIIVLSLPDMKDDTNETNQVKEEVQAQSTYDDSYVTNLENKLENILGKIPAAGTVDVMITLSNNGEDVILKDSASTNINTSETNENGSLDTHSENTKSDTAVIIEDSDNKSPYVISENQPKVEGVLVITSKNTDAKTINDINEAIMALFDIEAHKIKVINGS